jgi:hypothetical protein
MLTQMDRNLSLNLISKEIFYSWTFFQLCSLPNGDFLSPAAGYVPVLYC